MKKYLEINSIEELETIVVKAVENAMTKTIPKDFNLKDELLTMKQLCSYLKLSRVTIWSLCKNGIISYVRVGNQKRFVRSTILNELSQTSHQKNLNKINK